MNYYAILSALVFIAHATDVVKYQPQSVTVKEELQQLQKERLVSSDLALNPYDRTTVRFSDIKRQRMRKPPQSRSTEYQRESAELKKKQVVKKRVQRSSSGRNVDPLVAKFK